MTEANKPATAVIDMVNDETTRDRINNIHFLMTQAVPDGASSPDVATACFLILCQIAAFYGFGDDVIDDLKKNLDSSLMQAKMQFLSGLMFPYNSGLKSRLQ